MVPIAATLWVDMSVTEYVQVENENNSFSPITASTLKRETKKKKRSLNLRGRERRS
jgi:hypothetical protein